MRPIFDTVLIRWERGLVAVPESAGGREKFVEVRGVKTREEAVTLGMELLAVAKMDRATTAMTGHVFTGAQQPRGGFDLGDTIDGERVQSIAIGMDSEGATVVTPELGDPLSIALAAMERKLSRAGVGAASEWASPFTGEVASGERVDSTIPTFTIEPQPEYGGG